MEIDVVVAYDISDNKRRNKVAKALLRFGIRTQKSLFECKVTKKELKEMKRIIKKISDSDDLVTLYEFRESSVKRVGLEDKYCFYDLVF